MRNAVRDVRGGCHSSSTEPRKATREKGREVLDLWGLLTCVITLPGHLMRPRKVCRAHAGTILEAWLRAEVDDAVPAT